MFSIADLLKNRKIPGLQASEERRICADTAAALLKMPFSPKQFKYSESELTVSVSPLLKTELLMRRAEYEQLLSAQGIRITALR